jgi:hypothetical protein
MRPALLLDVDGVLNPYAALTCPDRYEEFGFFPGDDPPVRLCRAHGPWLTELAGQFEIVWATGWESEANRLIVPVLGLTEYPVIPFPDKPFDPRLKVPAIAEFIGDRPAVWIDDMHTDDGRAWAAARDVPTLLIDVDPAIGLTRPAVDEALAWAVRGREIVDS